MGHSVKSDSLDRWAEAFRTVLPRSDDEVIDFLAEVIVDSGFAPRVLEEDGRSKSDDSRAITGYTSTDEAEDDTLHSLLQEHLVLLLGKDPQETTFISRDVLDAYHLAFSSSNTDDEQTLLAPPRPDACELCERENHLTIHHLFPRSEHTYILSHPPADVDINITKQSLLTTHIAYLCRPCHSAVHRIADNRKLGQELFSIPRLLENPEVVKFVGYQAKQKTSGVNHSKFGLRYKR
jgi:hypothetical protein